MKEALLVEAQDDLDLLIPKLLQAEHIAVDTESNGFFAYFEKICLIQISTSTEDFVIDTLSMQTLQPLASVLSDPGIEKIFHAASNDISGLKRDFGFQFRNIFDTAIAAKMVGFKQLGLANILKEQFGIQLNKKWQRCDWGRRPLTQEQIDYARLDTHYLLDLRHRLARRIEEQNLMEQALLAFEKTCDTEASEERFANNGHVRIRGASHLNREAGKLLESLYHYRDRLARKRDRAPFRVISNEALLRLARSKPRNVDELKTIKGLPKSYRKGRPARSLLHVIHSTVANLEKAARNNDEPR